MIGSPARSCDLCGHAESRVIFDREFRVLVCRNCGLVFVDDVSRDYRRYYSEEYDYRLARGGRFTENQNDDESVFQWVTRHLPHGKDLILIEIGCSAGFLLKRFQECGIVVSGIEPGKRAAEFARRVNGIADIACCMLEDFEAGGRSCDVVLLIQTFEHFVDPLGNLLKIREFLAQNGLLFIEVPNYYAPNGFYLWKCKGIDYPSSNHLFVYSRRTLSAFLTKAGFSVCKTGYTLQNLRVIARVDGDVRDVKFDNYYRVMLHFHMLPVFVKAIDVLRFCKRKLARS